MITNFQVFCTVCPLGFHGVMCRAECGYPWYGKLCSSICNCSKAECHSALGCLSYGTYVYLAQSPDVIYFSQNITYKVFQTLTKEIYQVCIAVYEIDPIYFCSQSVTNLVNVLFSWGLRDIYSPHRL